MLRHAVLQVTFLRRIRVVSQKRIDIINDRSYIIVMPRPKNDQLRTKLLDEGVSVMIERGYHGTGLKEVLEGVGVPKGSFYNYFKSKEDFGAEVVRHFSVRLEKQMAASFEGPHEDALLTLRSFFQQVAEGHKPRRLGCLVGNLGAELGDTSEHVRQAMAEAMHRWRRNIAKILAEAQRQGTVRDDISAEELAEFMLDAFEGSLIRMKIEGTTEPLGKFQSRVIDDFILSKKAA